MRPDGKGSHESDEEKYGKNEREHEGFHPIAGNLKK
jgi:hypothetical protein